MAPTNEPVRNEGSVAQENNEEVFFYLVAPVKKEGRRIR